MEGGPVVPDGTTGKDSLLELARRLVSIPSVSRHEHEIASAIVEWFDAVPGRAGLVVDRIGDNVIARTDTGAARRVVLAGHLDTVPPAENGGEEGGREPTLSGRDERVGVLGAMETAVGLGNDDAARGLGHDDAARGRGHDDAARGLGATDMKGGLSVLCTLATTAGVAARRGLTLPYDLTAVLYAREEISRSDSGLLEIERDRPDLLEGDVAIMAEPTGGRVEAGCQGTLRALVTLRGRRAHTARPWQGSNAIHRLGALLRRMGEMELRSPEIDGISYREVLEAVHVSGGLSGNVVPDTACVTVNYRFAPDHDAEEAFRLLVDHLAPAMDEEAGDTVELVEAAGGALPMLDTPVLGELVRLSGSEPRAKLGWTDVAFFFGRGVPAANFGPGDPELSHTDHEEVSRSELVSAYSVLAELLGIG